MEVSTRGGAVNSLPALHRERVNGPQIGLRWGARALSLALTVCPLRRPATLLALLLSLFAVQLGVPWPEQDAGPTAQEAGSVDELSSPGDATPLRLSTRRSARPSVLATVAGLPPVEGRDDEVPQAGPDVPAPRFRSARYLVPRFGE